MYVDEEPEGMKWILQQSVEDLRFSSWLCSSSYCRQREHLFLLLQWVYRRTQNRLQRVCSDYMPSSSYYSHQLKYETKRKIQSKVDSLLLLSELLINLQWSNELSLYLYLFLSSLSFHSVRSLHDMVLILAHVTVNFFWEKEKETRINICTYVCRLGIQETDPVTHILLLEQHKVQYLTQIVLLTMAEMHP